MDSAILAQLQQQNGGALSINTLVEFKAGRMDYDGRMVKPDRRKGLIRIIKDA
jgi:hypothetical protein